MNGPISVPDYIVYLEAEVAKLSYLLQAQNAYSEHLKRITPYVIACDGVCCAVAAKSVDEVYMWLAETISHNNESGRIPLDFYEKVKNICNMARLREVVKIEPGITIS